MRPKPVTDLLKSVQGQTCYPDEIIIVDGSTNQLSKEAIESLDYKNLTYYLVDDNQRGLTKQRNFGIDKSSKEIICFLDDDIILTPTYFEKLLETYLTNAEAIGVGGYIIEDVSWRKLPENDSALFKEYEYDGYARPMGLRNILRKRLGLLSNTKPGIMPEFSNGLSISFLPPSGKTYEVEHFMGGVSSFNKTIFNKIKFSEYFEGYGLYEDSDFCLRASKLGPLFVNTAAKLYHYHDDSGRPNRYSYGKMVVRNGWYIWRLKYPKPSFKAKIKWNLIVLLLIKLRFLNIFTTTKKREAFTESFGRFFGWIGLLISKPKINRN